MGILTCSADHLHLLMQLLASHGLQLRDIGHNLPADALFNRQRHIPMQSLLEMLEHATASQPELALEFGLLLALQRSPATGALRDRLQEQQPPLFWQLFRATMTDDGDTAEIGLHWQPPSGWPERLPAVLQDILVAALHQHWLPLLQRHREQITLCLPGSVQAQRYRPYLSCRIQDHHHELAWRLPLHLLQEESTGAQPARPAATTIADRLTLAKSMNLLLSDLAQPPGLEQLSERLGTSERTLKRRLQHSGCHYQQLLSELRLQQAAWWLHEDGETVTTVAARLGYSSIANFSKAFRKWSGATPSQVRRYGAAAVADVDADA